MLPEIDQEHPVKLGGRRRKVTGFARRAARDGDVLCGVRPSDEVLAGLNHECGDVSARRIDNCIGHGDAVD